MSVSARSFSVVEPHPSVPHSTYIHAGRGGAGNRIHVNSTDLTPGATATGPASRAVISPAASSHRFMAGRGGAGNMRTERERAIFSFDEELERQRKLMEHQAPVYHIGRGGAGNMVDEMRPGSGVRKDSSSSTESHESHGRARRSLDNAWQRVSRSLSRS